jgi:hypothetical protein
MRLSQNYETTGDTGNTGTIRAFEIDGKSNKGIIKFPVFPVSPVVHSCQTLSDVRAPTWVMAELALKEHKK